MRIEASGVKISMAGSCRRHSHNVINAEHDEGKRKVLDAGKSQYLKLALLS
jgi:hypothetical protein